MIVMSQDRNGFVDAQMFRVINQECPRECACIETEQGFIIGHYANEERARIILKEMYGRAKDGRAYYMPEC